MANKKTEMAERKRQRRLKFYIYFIYMYIGTYFGHNAFKKQFEGSLSTMFVMVCVYKTKENQQMY